MKKLLFLFVINLFSNMLFAQEKSALQDDGMGLKYLVRQPLVKSEHSIVIILLHGRGGNENSLFSKSSELPANALIVAPRGPLELGGDAYGWYHVSYPTGADAPAPNPGEAEISRVALASFIQKIQAKYHIAPSRTYLMGFSQGGAMTLSEALTHPELVKGVVSLSGRVLDEIQANTLDKVQLKNLSIFMGHGTEDKLLPVKYARQNQTFLKALNIALSYHEYKITHEISQAEMKDVQEWFRKELN